MTVRGFGLLAALSTIRASGLRQPLAQTNLETRLFMEEIRGKRINRHRSEELLALNAETVAAACLFCITMLGKTASPTAAVKRRPGTLARAWMKLPLTSSEHFDGSRT